MATVTVMLDPDTKQSWRNAREAIIKVIKVTYTCVKEVRAKNVYVKQCGSIVSSKTETRYSI